MTLECLCYLQNLSSLPDEINLQQGLDAASESYYMSRLRLIWDSAFQDSSGRATEFQALELDCIHLYEYNRKLYEVLVKQPSEVLPLLDRVVWDISRSMLEGRQDIDPSGFKIKVLERFKFDLKFGGICVYYIVTLSSTFSTSESSLFSFNRLHCLFKESRYGLKIYSVSYSNSVVNFLL